MSADHGAAQQANSLVQQSTGVNQTGVRAHNERLVLSQIRLHGALSKADIARMTGLSAQAVSVIIRNLEAEEILQRQKVTRGRVGQPSTPMALNPDGAFSVGLRLGRRSADLALMDLVGNVRDLIKVTYNYPTPKRILDFVDAHLGELVSSVKKSRVLGVGISAPFELYNWLDRLGAPQDQMATWRDYDLAADISVRTGFSTILVNDATCACVAEHAIGGGAAYDDFAYFFVGSFIGGGIVLNGKVQTGPTGNAGAFGPLPSATPGNPKAQLIDTASLYFLEADIAASGMDASTMWAQTESWEMFEPHVSNWIERTAPAIAKAALTVCAVIDFPVIFIDGAFPSSVREVLAEKVRRAMSGFNTDGIIVPEILSGKAGANARVIGAALLPINSRFFYDPVRAGATDALLT
ncbi:MAG: ROK family transcriptional regulator [Pseudomonadota bacterium]